jgi:hypothetical protein
VSAFCVDGNFTVARPRGQPRITTPFAYAGDSQSFFYEQDYDQYGAYFKPLPLGTRAQFTIGGKAVTVFLVGETPTSDRGGGVVQWTRVYSVIPASREEHQQYSYTFPGLKGGTLYVPSAITASSVGASGTTLTTAADLDAGDTVKITYSVRAQAGNGVTTQYGRTVARTVLSAGGGTVTVALISDIGTISFIGIVKTDVARDPVTRNVWSVVQFDYFLTGVSPGVASYRDIPIIEPEFIYDAEAKETATYTAETSPTVTEYKALIAAGTWIVAEASVIRNWKGTIYERATRYVKAQ